VNIFDQANKWVRSTESSFVNLVSAIAPWAAPLAPAYMSYTHMIDYLGFPEWIAMAVALVVEALGLSTINTSVAFWMHNKRYKLDAKRAPVFAAVFSFVSYLLIILTLNVMIEWFPEAREVKIIAKGLLTLLSIPAAITMAIRTQHHDLIQEIYNDKQERKAQKNTPVLYERTQNRTRSDIGNKKSEVIEFVKKIEEEEKRTPGPTEVSKEVGVAKSYAHSVLAFMKPEVADIKKMGKEERENTAKLSSEEIMAAYHVTQKTADNWRIWLYNNGYSIKVD